MKNTGRITREPNATARAILFGVNANANIDSELRIATEVDRAHVVMLAERDILARSTAAKILQAIAQLRASNFAELRGKPAPRGLFLLYEDHLIERLGHDDGGILQTGRSRNDLNATTVRMRLRAPYVRLVREALRLQAVLLRRAERFIGVVMPAYTHHQPAVPITLGHYLAGLANALGRDIAALLEAGTDLERSPLGAGAVGGTSVPIAPERTAELLGFSRTARNSLDAVASRDFVLRLLGAASVLGVTLSRLATDLLLWTTQEFGFLSLPDELVGSSSMMPQKRNPFMLEHVQGRGMAVVGALVSAAGAMHATPYTNAIAVGTEATHAMWSALSNATDVLILTRLMVMGARPNEATMLERAEEGYTVATELATRLAVEGGMAFRSAHHVVGAIVKDAVERGETGLRPAVSRWSASAGNEAKAPLEPLSATEVVARSRYGGGPAEDSIRADLRECRDEWLRHRAVLQKRRAVWRAAQRRLDQAERELLSIREATPGLQPQQALFPQTGAR